MKIEILFPEFCNLFGDLSNMRYLQECLPKADFIETSLDSEPLFARENPALIYLGPMTERTQKKVIEALRPHRERLQTLIESGTVFLFTGNASEVLGNYIENEDGSRIEGLGLLPIWAKRDMMNRHNSTYLGSFQGEPVMGFKSQFTMTYPDPEVPGLFETERGMGLNRECKYEGVRVNNFFGTYLLGPLLINNPPFTRSLLGLMGAEDPTPAFSAQVEAAYDQRLQDFKADTSEADRPPEGNQLPIHLPRFGKK